MALKIVVTGGAKRARATVRGTLDEDSARVLRLKAQSLLATGRKTLVLDLTETDLVGDAGLMALAYVRRIYRLAGARVTIVAAGAELDMRLAVIEAAEQVVAQTVFVDG